jgi:hypothetical protein
MDPNNPQPMRRDSMSLNRVQTWVLSTLAVITILHMSAGLVLAALVADTVDACIGLLVIAGLFGSFPSSPPSPSTNGDRSVGGCCSAGYPASSAPTSSSGSDR